MVEINYCPSCGAKLIKGSFICPSCNRDIEELFGGNLEDEVHIVENNSIGDGNLDNPNINVQSGDEIVIIIPEDADPEELVIDLDELGIDVENLGEDVEIVIQVEGENFDEDIGLLDEDDDEMLEANEWYFDDDPYGIVYYEFVNDED